KQAAVTQQQRPSTNKNIKKLRAISMVCSLTSSWQQWAAENEKKQASEPSGWTPSSLGGPTEKDRKQWIPKNPPPTTEPQPADGPRTHKDEPSIGAAIKVKNVVKTVTSGVQEKSLGISLLTEKIKRDHLPSEDEIDRILKKKSSPTRRRKCSNVVSSLTRSWKQVENRPGRQGGGDPGERTSWAGSGEGAVVETEDSESVEKAPEDESEVKIKRSTVSMYKKEAEDANKISVLSKQYSAVGQLKSRWQDWASEHSQNQKLNPFSEYFDYDYSMSLRLQKGQDGYGRPREGTKTAERAQRAERHIHREMDDMCYVIRTMAEPDPDGKTRVTFGQLFDRYVRISDKVVGILMRARKHGKVAFEGEMLWQGQDDGVIITLLV
uniref:Actin-binding Rho-activating protein n=1 Tax=Tetraodon nigroviridis TaxID=99883 RepID=H3DK50_TETNG